MWGPFRIHQVVYQRSLGVKEILDIGAAEYRAILKFFRNRSVSSGHQ